MQLKPIIGLLHLTLLLTAATTWAEPTPDTRPPLDKGDFLQSVWAYHQHETIAKSQAPEQIDFTIIESFGPNNAELDFVHLAHLLEEAGITGIYAVDLAQVPGASQDASGRSPLEVVLDAFAAAGNDRKLAFASSNGVRRAIRNQVDFDSLPAEQAAEAVADFWVKILTEHENIFRHPNYATIDGRPVIASYGSFGAPLAVWKRALPLIESRAYACVWIFGCSSPQYAEAKPWLPYVDGVTAYGSRRDHEAFAEYIRSSYPQKIWQPSIEPNAVGAGYGWSHAGSNKSLHTYYYRAWWDRVIAGDNDAVAIADIGELQENRHFLPAYQPLTTFWELTRENIARYRNEPVPRTTPELFVTNPIALMLGEVLEIEVLGFQISGDDRDVRLDLRLLDAQGRTVHRFATRTVSFDSLKAERFRVPSIDFAQEFALYPQLTYTHAGRTYGPYRCRPTRLWVNHTPTAMTWSTPIEMLDPRLDVAFRGELESARRQDIVDRGAVPPHDPRISGEGVAYAGGMIALTPGPSASVLLEHSALNAPGVRYESSLLINGRPFSELVPVLAGEHQRRYLLPAGPPPITWAEAELFAFEHVALTVGDRKEHIRRRTGYHLSLPVYMVRDKSWLEPVAVNVPVLDPNAKQYDTAREKLNGAYLAQVPVAEYRQLRLPKYRVPYFHYRFDRDHGEIAFDVSGYRHHGWVGGLSMSSVPGAYFHEIGYDFRHLIGGWFPKVSSQAEEFRSNPAVPSYQQDRDGTYLAFDGEHDRVILPLHTVMPFAETVEIVAKPAATGRTMTLYNAQGDPSAPMFMKMRLSLDGDGRLVAEFPYAEASVRSDRRVEPDQWTALAVVNDGQRARLFINGEPASEAVAVKSWLWHRSKSYALLGLGTTGQTWSSLRGTARPLPNTNQHYRGGMREVRITARALSPHELLRPDETR